MVAMLDRALAAAPEPAPADTSAPAEQAAKPLPTLAELHREYPAEERRIDSMRIECLERWITARDEAAALRAGKAEG
jgi:hypothetical protein